MNLRSSGRSGPRSLGASSFGALWELTEQTDGRTHTLVLVYIDIRDIQNFFDRRFSGWLVS